MIRFTEFSNNETKLIKLKDSCSFFSGGTPSSSNKNYYTGNIPFIRSGEIHKNDTELKINENALNNSSAKMVNKGDLLLALYGATSGEIDISQINGAINQAILCIRPNDEINKYYLKYKLEYEKDNILKTYLQGGQGNLSAEIIKNLSYKFPSMNEQTKVSNFLSLLDKKIELQSKKIEDLKLFKKGLFSSFKFNSVRNIKLSEILSEINIKSNVNNQYEILSSTSSGLFLQKEYFKKQAASENNIGYKILKKNQLVLSPQNLWMGNININDKYEIGIVSPSYKIFNINDDIINISFFNNWIKSPRALYDYTISSEQGASVVRRNLNMELFNEIIIKVPERNIQNKIGKQLNNINRKIELEIDKLTKLNSLKKGLIQNMFV